MSDWQSRVLVTIIDVKGSAPREVGAHMTIFQDGSQTGTIGGGALEWQATRHAQSLLANNAGYLRQEKELILGPDLEQCCGGVVRLSFEFFTAAEKDQLSDTLPDALPDRQNLVLFGAGHVGKALVAALADHEFNVAWVDSRAEIFPALIPDNIQVRTAKAPLKALDEITDNTIVLIMSHCHKLDYAISSAALQNPYVSFVGLIGSMTKKARFVKRFAADGLTLDQISRLVCPVGITEIQSKKPAAIAVSILAQLLIEKDLVKTGKNTVLLRQNRA